MNIVFPNLRARDAANQRRNFMEPDEMVDFYEQLLYDAAKFTLHPTFRQRIPPTHKIAELRSRKGTGHMGRCQISMPVSQMIKVVNEMRLMLADIEDLEEECDVPFARSMSKRFKDFTFVLNIRNIKDACHVMYQSYALSDRLSDSVSQMLRDAILFIDWDRVQVVAEHVVVDYGIEWLPVVRVRPTTLVWYLPRLMNIVENHGVVKCDEDVFCHMRNRGGLRAVLGGPEADALGAVYCQFYLGEKSLVYNYHLAHNQQRLKSEDLLKNKTAFVNLMDLSNSAADEGMIMNLGARAEYRMAMKTDEFLGEFVHELVQSVFWQKALLKISSKVLFGLKRERNRAVQYMVQRLKEVTSGGNELPMYVNVATYVRYVFLGTLSRPDEYSISRRLVKKYQVKTNMEHLGLPIADWLSVRYLFLNPTSPYAALPATELDEPPANFGAPPPGVVAAEQLELHLSRPLRQAHNPDSTTRHVGRQAQIPMPFGYQQQEAEQQQAEQPVLQYEPPAQEAVNTRQ
ncbi:hypothetical protein IWW41_003143, partial [Coemansia sp. RSA 2522]